MGIVDIFLCLASRPEGRSNTYRSGLSLKVKTGDISWPVTGITPTGHTVYPLVRTLLRTFICEEMFKINNKKIKAKK